MTKEEQAAIEAKIESNLKGARAKDSSKSIFDVLRASRGTGTTTTIEQVAEDKDSASIDYRVTSVTVVRVSTSGLEVLP